MAMVDLGEAAALVKDLQECHLLAPDGLRQATAYLQAGRRTSAELADFLVRQGLLTRFQANWALEERARELVLSQFVLTEVIGTGSLGSVYKARSTRSDGWYALKVVPRRNVVSFQIVADKVQALRDIRHPRVSALVHLGAAGGQVYLAWPFLDGGETLEAMVRRQGKLSPRQAVQVGVQVASGLLPYHEQGLFHGLLKPTDILIGSDRRVRILDFGVGFLLASERGKSLLDTMTNTRALARGLDCSSPESIMNPLDRTPAGDQYSLGCVLYFCLTGQYPFPHENPVKKMLAHQAEEPEPLRKLNPQVSPRLAGIVERLMRKAPEERYDDIAEVIREFQALNPSGSRPTVRVTPPVDSPPQEKTANQSEGPRQAWGTVPLLLAGLGAGAVVGAIASALLVRP